MRLRETLCGLALVSVWAACSGTEPAVSVDDDEATSTLPACDPDNGGLTLPDGFCAFVVADNLGRARHLDVAENGDIYVHDRGSRGEEENAPNAGIIALRDADGDGRAETIERFSQHYGTGLQLRDGYLYYSTTTEIYRQPMIPGELLPQGTPELIVSGFPDQRSHSAKAMAFDDSGQMYVNVGAPSNACMEVARTRGSVGQEPCEQLVWQAGVWRFDADTPGQTQEDDGFQFVRGIRNIVGMAWDPTTGGIYAVQHGRDSLGSLWDFDDVGNAEMPSEELFRLIEGANFGWPFCYHDRFQDKRLLAPEYGGDGTAEGDCGQYDLPLVAFPGHWAPDDLLFYGGSQFPDRYRDGVFVVFHGSWNRAPLEQGGYKVVFAPRANAEFTGEWEDFAVGFAGAAALMAPQDALHRPVGIAQGPDGSIYVTDDVGGRLWRIIYTG